MAQKAKIFSIFCEKGKFSQQLVLRKNVYLSLLEAILLHQTFRLRRDTIVKNIYKKKRKHNIF